MIRQLPQFKGYTVDARLKEFRKMDGALKILPFDSDEGGELLSEYIHTLDVKSDEFKEIANAVL